MLLLISWRAENTPFSAAFHMPKGTGLTISDFTAVTMANSKPSAPHSFAGLVMQHPVTDYGSMVDSVFVTSLSSTSRHPLDPITSSEFACVTSRKRTGVASVSELS